MRRNQLELVITGKIIGKKRQRNADGETSGQPGLAGISSFLPNMFTQRLNEHAQEG